MKSNKVMTRISPRRLNIDMALILAVTAAVLMLSGPAVSAQTQERAPVRMIPASFADVAQKASPAVVNISTVKNAKEAGPRGLPFRGPQAPPGRRDPFQEFFEKFFGDRLPHRDRKERSLGSGFIIDPSGLVVTNNHVIEGADKIMVRLSGGKELEGKVLGRDKKTDLALIRIKNETRLPHLALGDSRKVRIGDWVVAIGNPFGLEHTVTAGILSARGRALGAGPYDDFLQTDASINPGNSGGPLLNLEGEVIGINTAIIAGGQGIGFAIPTNLARDILDQLKKKGKVVRGWLGVMIQKVTPDLAKSFGLEEPAGALVGDVTKGGPAEKAGLKRGDVIISFDGKKVEEWNDLPAMVAATPVGTKAKVQVIRGGKKKIFMVTIGELKEKRMAAMGPAQTEGLGLTVRDLTPELAERLGLSETEGVLIAEVAEDSPASESGLKPGDLIVELNRQPVRNLDHYRRAVQGLKTGDTVLFLIRRGPSTLFFTLKAG